MFKVRRARSKLVGIIYKYFIKDIYKSNWKKFMFLIFLVAMVFVLKVLLKQAYWKSRRIHSKASRLYNHMSNYMARAVDGCFKGLYIYSERQFTKLSNRKIPGLDYNFAQKITFHPRRILDRNGN